MCRCYASQCRKFVRDIIWECRCGGKYCLDHRLPEVHDCKFDFKQNGKEILEKGLVRIVGEKIQRV